MTTSATIRPTDEADAPAVAALVALALEDKYRPALGAAAEAGIAALVRRDVREVPICRRWVAEIDGRIAGTVTLALGQDVAEGFARTMAAEIGWPRAVRATLVLGLMGHGRLGADEAYIDELAVAEWARRRGVGRGLLGTCEDAARSAARTRLTLWVTINNPAARALYEGFGFLEARRRRWIAGRILFKAPGAILMERPLAPR